MPVKEELYKHKQIKGETYTVGTVDNGKRVVYLKNTNKREALIRVTFDQLDASYERA